MLFLRNPSTDPQYNMSFDEWCLEHLPSDDTFFYLWRNSPSVIVGRNQVIEDEVNVDYAREHGIQIVRRSTGGGAVYHDLQNLNYSFVGKGATPQPIVEALRSFGVPAELTGRNDIFVDGLKVSGYARRLDFGNCLVHGTLMWDVDLDVLTSVLDTPVSKLHGKGVASVRSRVGNLKDWLPQFKSIEEFEDALQQFLANF